MKKKQFWKKKKQRSGVVGLASQPAWPILSGPTREPSPASKRDSAFNIFCLQLGDLTQIFLKKNHTTRHLLKQMTRCLICSNFSHHSDRKIEA